MKILMTGGHFSPALSVIQELKNKAEIIFVGREYSFEGDKGKSFEYKVCTMLGIPFYPLNTARLQRKLTKYTIPSLFKAPGGIVEAFRIVRNVRPDVVLTFGGYIGVPVAVASFLFGIPIVLHEQTQKAGLANKIIVFLAKKICISFKSSEKYFPQNKVILTGNPVRQEIFSVQKGFKVPEGFKILYITGGSGGSHFINSNISKIIKELLEKYVVIHQTGDSQEFRDYDKLSELRKSFESKFQDRYLLRKFIFPEEIGWVYRNSSLVVSRSGINTVCELILLSKVCLLIPLASGQVNEQLDNAMIIKKLGIGDYMEAHEVHKDAFYKKIVYMLENEKEYKKNTEKCQDFLFPDAGKRIVNVLKSEYEKKNKKKIRLGI